VWDDLDLKSKVKTSARYGKNTTDHDTATSWAPPRSTSPWIILKTCTSRLNSLIILTDSSKLSDKDTVLQEVSLDYRLFSQEAEMQALCVI